MTSITLNSRNTSSANQPGVGTALSELTVAARHLGAALLSTVWRPSAVRQPLTAAEQAESLRDYAQNFVKTDPGFAADLFAAALRHEQTGGA